MEAVVKKLLDEIQGENNKETIKPYENLIIENIEEAVNVNDFPRLPVSDIISILSQTNFTQHNISLLINAIKKMIEIHKEEPETLQLLHSLKKQNLPTLSFNDCISILECFTNSDLFVIFTELNKNQDVEKLNKEIERLNEEINQIKNKPDLPPMTEDLARHVNIQSSALHGNLRAVKYLVETKGVAINPEGSRCFTPLMHAASGAIHHPYESLAVVNYLIEKGADVNPKDAYDRKTPLHLASTVLVAKALVEHGANIEAVNYDGYTPLAQHVIEKYDDIVEYLVTVGASTKGALHVAWKLNIVKILVEHGADIEEVNYQGHTPLMHFSMRGNVEIVKYLLSVGANKNAKDKNGKTAYDLACTGERVDQSNKEALQEILK